jgi:archaellum component FlaF (FlaF/FlaG flagellin family)
MNGAAMKNTTSVVTWISVACASAWAQATTRVSVDSGGTQGNNLSQQVSMSADGGVVAFESYASNLVPADTNGFPDVFVHEMVNGSTTRVSVDSNGMQANNGSYDPVISSDGRWVAFMSIATNLVPGDTNGFQDVFVHDRLTGATTRVSVDSGGTQANGLSVLPSISSDGRYVSFESAATNLVPGDTNGFRDIFVRDRVSGMTTRASLASSGAQGNGYSAYSAISADGRYVAFYSEATNLVPGDTNGFGDVFVHDMVTGTTTRVSVSSNGAQGNGGSAFPAISADGRYVAFWSHASNLVLGDTNGANDVFVHDMVNGSTTRVSVDSHGVQDNGETNADPFEPSLSFDGRYVAFTSFATNLVPGDTNADYDVFLHDMLSGSTVRVSVDSSGTQGNGGSYYSTVSSDGRYVAFASGANNLIPGDTNGYADVFVRDSGAASAFTSLCFGDGTGGICPCGNSGSSGHGCENSAATGGAILTATGNASLSADTVQLHSSGELPTALSIIFQGGTVVAPTTFGDGLRCAGGTLKRLYVKGASGGSITAPQTGDPSISMRSATLGDPISLGATRTYQVYYHDANLVFCPGGFNASGAVAIAWGS